MNKEPFEFGERLGIFLIVEAAAMSTIAVSMLLIYVGWRLSQKYRSGRARSQQTWGIEQEDASNSYYFISLMIGELVQALGGMLNIRWIADAGVTEGSLCTAQGVLKQVGDVAVALTSLAIAIQTFTVLALRCREPWWTPMIVIAVIWIFTALDVGVGAATHPPDYYGDTGYWCWISDEYGTERVTLEYLWLWVALVGLVLIYGAIALVMRGILVFDGGVQLRLQSLVRMDLTSPSGNEDDRRMKQVANLMMFYPLVYAICVFPVSLVRWLAFNDDVQVPPGATIFASVLFSLSGFFNAILYKETRMQAREVKKPAMPDIQLDSASERNVDGRGRMPDFDMPEDEEMGTRPSGSFVNGSYISLHGKDYD